MQVTVQDLEEQWVISSCWHYFIHRHHHSACMPLSFTAAATALCFGRSVTSWTASSAVVSVCSDLFQPGIALAALRTLPFGLERNCLLQWAAEAEMTGRNWATCPWSFLAYVTLILMFIIIITIIIIVIVIVIVIVIIRDMSFQWIIPLMKWCILYCTVNWCHSAGVCSDVHQCTSM